MGIRASVNGLMTVLASIFFRWTHGNSAQKTTRGRITRRRHDAMKMDCISERQEKEAKPHIFST